MLCLTMKNVLFQLIYKMTEVDWSFDNVKRLDKTSDLHLRDPISLPPGKEYHIYLAYTDEDVPFLIKLDKLLRSKGFICCIHDRDFVAGSSIAENIVKYIERSVKFVFLLSKNSINNGWMQFEFDVAQIFQIEEIGYKPIILKLDNCDRPEYLKHYTYLQADGPLDEWVGLLLRAINEQTGKLTLN